MTDGPGVVSVRIIPVLIFVFTITARLFTPQPTCQPEVNNLVILIPRSRHSLRYKRGKKVLFVV